MNSEPADLHPAAVIRLYEWPAMNCEVLVTTWADGTQEVATRRPFSTWGPPLRLVREEQA